MLTVSRLPYPVLPCSPPLSPCPVDYGVPDMEYSSVPQDNDFANFGLGAPSQSSAQDDMLRFDQAMTAHHLDRDGIFDTDSMLAQSVQVGAGSLMVDTYGQAYATQADATQASSCSDSHTFAVPAALDCSVQPSRQWMKHESSDNPFAFTLLSATTSPRSPTSGVSSPTGSALFSPSSSLSSSPVSGEAAATRAGDVNESFSLIGPYHSDGTDDTAEALPPPDDTNDRLLVSASSSAPTSPTRVLSSSRRSRRHRRHRHRAVKRSAVMREPYTTSDGDSSASDTPRLGMARGGSTGGGCSSSSSPLPSTARPARVPDAAAPAVMMEPAPSSSAIKMESLHPPIASSSSSKSPSARQQLECERERRHNLTVKARGSGTRADPCEVSDDDLEEVKTASSPLASPLVRRGGCGGTVKCELSVLDDEDEDSCGHGMPPLEADPSDHSPSLHTSRAPTNRPVKRVRSDSPAGSLADDDSGRGLIACRHSCGCVPSKFCKTGSDRMHNGRQLVSATSLRDHETNLHLHPHCPQTGICGRVLQDLRAPRSSKTKGPVQDPTVDRMVPLCDAAVSFDLHFNGDGILAHSTEVGVGPLMDAADPQALFATSDVSVKRGKPGAQQGVCDTTFALPSAATSPLSPSSGLSLWSSSPSLLSSSSSQCVDADAVYGNLHSYESFSLNSPRTGNATSNTIMTQHPDCPSDISHVPTPSSILTNIPSVTGTATSTNPVIAKQEAAIKLLRELMDQHGLIAEGWQAGFDWAKARCGACSHSLRHITLSRYYVISQPMADIRNTCLHEIAHALVGSHAKHGPSWKAKAIAIGCDGKRCSENEFHEMRFQVSCEKRCKVYKRHRVAPQLLKMLCARCRTPLRIVAQ